MEKILLKAKNLKKYFSLKKEFLKETQYVKAVDDIDLTIYEGETLGIVGESGCGKSTLGRILLNLITPDAGEIIYQGRNILELSKKEMRSLRKEMQIIFQDPFSSLDPRFRIKDIVGEGLEVFYPREGKQFIKDRVDEILALVGLPKEIKNRYPHEFSGGQRQRISIARSIVLKPNFIVCDEPVSSLDVSIQAQIINLLKSLKEKLNLSYLFIAHDLSVVNYISDQIAVIYLGKIVEYGKAEKVCKSPVHPYTKALIAAIPQISAKKSGEVKLKAEVDVSVNQIQGCSFYPRCKEALDICKKEVPRLKKNDDTHSVACHLY